ncbi:DHH phosphoesterase [Lactarius akahatsu]|uniref:DHH phosphoesterase n=1 Tax=Lactarius akahatsu TaxID=416441 RepID=A0AAD4LII9_9AGAM|nr:DHH phosphoesterase [Lactarius akahatsu]
MSEAVVSAESSSAPSNLLEFLRVQKSGYLQALEKGDTQNDRWTISLGNEAGDLDSLASAVAYAWYATHHLGQSTVPLLQTPRADISLRAENLYALDFSGKYALVDHNTLTGRFAAYERVRVVAIIDHHEDEKHHLDASPRIIEVPTGSCSSLVARLIKKEWPEGMSRAVARLLLSAILIDTGGLKAGGKAETADREVAPFLLERAELTSEGVGTLVDNQGMKGVKELTKTLEAKKDSVDHLGARDLLRRDYKEYRFVPSWNAEGTLVVGLASVPRGIKAITGGDEKGGKVLGAACVAWLQEKGLDMLGVLTSWKDKGKHRREMVWVVRDDKEAKQRLWKGLEGSKELKLQRKEGKKYVDGMESGVGKGLKVRVYEQGNAHATRKVTAPLIRVIVEGRE